MLHPIFILFAIRLCTVERHGGQIVYPENWRDGFKCF